MTKKLTVSNIEKVINYLKLNDKNCYWNYKGEVNLEEVEIVEDYEFSYCAGMLTGSEFVGFLIVKDEKAIDDESPLYYSNYKYVDKRKVYNEYGIDIHKDRSREPLISWHDNNLYIFAIYYNYNDNEVINYNLDYYYIK